MDNLVMWNKIAADWIIAKECFAYGATIFFILSMFVVSRINANRFMLASVTIIYMCLVTLFIYVQFGRINDATALHGAINAAYFNQGQNDLTINSKGTMFPDCINASIKESHKNMRQLSYLQRVFVIYYVVANEKQLPGNEIEEGLMYELIILFAAISLYVIKTKLPA